MHDEFIIVLDSNALGNYKKSSLDCDDFNYFSTDKECFFSLISFVNNNLTKKVKVAIPKIVLEEIKKQQCELFELKKEKLETVFAPFQKLEGFLLEKPSNFDYKSFLDTKIENFLGVYDIIQIDYPDDIVLPKLIKKVIEKMKPFYKKKNGRDSGFKDAILWESLLKFAKANSSKKYILFSGDSDLDSDFLQDEFRNETGSNLEIKKHLADIKGFLQAVIDNNSEFEEIISLYKLNNSYFNEILGKYMQEIKLNGQIFRVRGIKLGENIEDIQKTDGQYNLSVECYVEHETIYSGYGMMDNSHSFYETDTVLEEVVFTIVKSEGIFILKEINFLSERFNSVKEINQNIF